MWHSYVSTASIVEVVYVCLGGLSTGVCIRIFNFHTIGVYLKIIIIIDNR